MFGFFRKNREVKPAVDQNQLVAVADGKVIRMEDVNDPVFSEKMMGDGVAVVPTGTTVVAPCAGTVTMIADTGHAFGMECDNGLELLVHIGIDTVSLGGKGFTVVGKAGEHVEAGAPMIEFDPEVIRTAGLDMTTPIIILEDGGKSIEMSYPEAAKAGETVVMECR
ncbi:MAG: PTS glucose transporter subunit IIA [Lachnospiraceae bacterium]|nr:PTS glucose transporter subunit IIA [Lachnospiraceae bacterium]